MITWSRALVHDGLTGIPPGKIASVVTFLEIGPSARRPAPRLAEHSLEKLGRGDTAAYRKIFTRVGQNWLWFSRTMLSEGELGAILGSPNTVVIVLRNGTDPIGFAEIDRSHEGEAKITFFGVVPEAYGTGASQFLMRRTLRDLFKEGMNRVWLHTCTFDHPAAIRFYQSEGFRAFRVAVEIAEDPRLSGLLPPEAAPHIPVIRPK